MAWLRQSTMRRYRLSRLLALAVLPLAAFRLVADEPAASKSWAFIRSSELADKAMAAQTLSAEYRPEAGGGPAVWLVGVSHLGTGSYYKALQERLDRHTVVLFEGIGADGEKKDGEHGAGMQGQLAKALGLVFQLDAIDYDRPNFVNSDLPMDKLRAQVRERSKDASPEDADRTLSTLVDAMQGTGEIGAAVTQLTDMIGSSEAMREMTKAVLIELLGRAGEIIEMASSQSPEVKTLFEVILAERNKTVLRDVRVQLAKLKPGETVAIFYGAAHMDEIARDLREKLHYVPAQQEWETAFSTDPTKSGLDSVQARMIVDMIKGGMQLAPKPAPPAPKEAESAPKAAEPATAD